MHTLSEASADVITKWFLYITVWSYIFVVYREGDLRVIRPFAYVREKDLRNFADKVSWPVIDKNY